MSADQATSQVTMSPEEFSRRLETLIKEAHAAGVRSGVVTTKLLVAAKREACR